MKKRIKDLKIGDNLYFLDTDRHRITINKVTNIEEYSDEYDYDDKYLKVTWEEEDYCLFPNFCVVKEEDTSFWEEPDYDAEDYNEDDEDEERLVFLNREDIISRLKEEVDRLQKWIEEMP